MGMLSMNKFYQLCEWILRLAYLNLLWILFTCTGMIIFGLFPATAAAFSVALEWRKGKADTPVFKTFKNSYKAEFLRSQLIGFAFLAAGFLLFFYLTYFYSEFSSYQSVISVLIFILVFFYLSALVFIFPVFVRYQLSFSQYIKNAAALSILNPFQTFICLSGMTILGFILAFFPGLAPFFCISLPVMLITAVTQKTFIKAGWTQSAYQQHDLSEQ
ncbi:YesL family protein [Metabacillus idriensis]|uniref:YesL family protein n=1 Tax=Metabacillus idriensis TaxID=324768 RepID=UPI002812CB7D|nr:YesL family protein [Metabacillus idriensis]MDR0138637.1 YesL family protein [Metabacillus idriensis]